MENEKKDLHLLGFFPPPPPPCPRPSHWFPRPPSLHVHSTFSASSPNLSVRQCVCRCALLTVLWSHLPTVAALSPATRTASSPFASPAASPPPAAPNQWKCTGPSCPHWLPWMLFCLFLWMLLPSHCTSPPQPPTAFSLIVTTVCATCWSVSLQKLPLFSALDFLKCHLRGFKQSFIFFCLSLSVSLPLCHPPPPPPLHPLPFHRGTMSVCVLPMQKTVWTQRATD